MKPSSLEHPDISITQLEEVFTAFNQVSEELGTSYRELESRVSDLSEELAATHSARVNELTEKEQLAAKLSGLMYALPGGVITMDCAGIIKEENPVAIQLLGESFQGRSWQQALGYAGLAEPILSGEVSFKNGKRISISSSRYGNDDRIIVLLTDVSENYRLNNMLNREQRLAALGEMAARLAHQVRTPLSSAILYLSHLSFPTAENERSKGIAKKILSRLQQIERLIEGMLSYIRGDINDKQEFSLNDLLEEVKDATSFQIKESNGCLKLNRLGKPCVIQGDHEALFNALSNLVENSVQAVKNNPDIIISLSEERGFYIIRVEDNGPGIDDSIKERLFDPFFSTRTVGTGLGLAVVLSAVKAHGGEISVRNAANGGAIFQLSIPTDVNILGDESGIWETDPQQQIGNISPSFTEERQTGI